MLDRTTVGALVATVILLIVVLAIGSGLAIGAFWQTSSLLLVVGGALLTTVISHGRGPAAIGRLIHQACTTGVRPAEEAIIMLMAMAEVARRDGLLALERPVAGIQDGFLRRSMQMAIDGTDAATIQSVMQTELESTDLRHTVGAGFLETMGKSAPVFGMIGTVIGLVVMLGRMTDPSTIGPGMAVALLTTLYGLVLANVFCLPLARKLRLRSSEELLCKTLMLKGVLAIQAGDYPRVVEQKLRAFLPADRPLYQASQELIESVKALRILAEARPASPVGTENAEMPSVEPTPPTDGAPRRSQMEALMDEILRVRGKRPRLDEAA